MAKKVEKITVDMHADRLPQDLERYVQKALELGATHAAVIKAEDIPVDERIPLKCQIPRCFGYGAGAHCPPNTLKPAELRDLLQKYHWAVLFTMDVPPEVIVRDKATIKERVAAYQKIFKMVSEVESLAFYDGHYLAFGFGAGSCRHTFCGQQEILPGHGRQEMPLLPGLPALHGGGGHRRLPTGGPPGLGHLPHRQRRQTRGHAQGRPGRHRYCAIERRSAFSRAPLQVGCGAGHADFGENRCKSIH